MASANVVSGLGGGASARRAGRARVGGARARWREPVRGRSVSVCGWTPLKPLKPPKPHTQYLTHSVFRKMVYTPNNDMYTPNNDVYTPRKMVYTATSGLLERSDVYTPASCCININVGCIHFVRWCRQQAGCVYSTPSCSVIVMYTH